MSYELRPYQVTMYDEARGLVLAGSKSILIQLPTGGGKTVLVAKMLDSAAQKGKRAWFNVHRRELVKQSVRTFHDATAHDVGVVAAGFPGNRHLPIQICSIGTLRQRRKLLQDPHLIVWDECHHTAAASWDEIHAAYPGAVHIGVTATPERLDGRGLRGHFKEMILGPSTARLIEDGYLSKYKLYAPSVPDLSGVHTVAGDYNKKELSAAMSKSAVVGDVITHYRRHADGKRMIAFAWSIEASIDIAAKFNANGIPAAHVDGKTDDRERDLAMERFKAGEIKVLTNVELFGEGVDVPAMEAVALLRPTQSLALYLQQVGRALRPYPGKDYAIILDHAGNCKRFGLPDDDREWSLDGRKKGKPGDYAAPIRQCHRCFAVVSASRDMCPYCGVKFLTQSREIEQVEGELSEVDLKSLQRDQHKMEERFAETLDDFIRIGRLRKYKNPEKWAHYKYKARLARKAGKDAMNWLGLDAPGVNGRQ